MNVSSVKATTSPERRALPPRPAAPSVPPAPKPADLWPSSPEVYTPSTDGDRTAPQTPERLLITASPEISPSDLQRLRQTALTAIAYFEEHFGPVTSPLRFEVGKASTALRTGYNFAEDVVNLPTMETVRNSGLDSVDILNHEIFHALLVKAYPELPVVDESARGGGAVRLHEALADLFAHRLQPDKHFGEDYYLGKDHVREYHTSLRLGLTAGAHAQGNAITSMLLANGIGNGEIRRFLEAGDFTVKGLAAVSPTLAQALDNDSALSVGEQVTSYPHSTRGSYWLRPDQPLDLAFLPNAKLQEEHPNFRVVWLDKNGIPSRKYTFTPSGEHAFQVSGAPDADSEKVIARFYDGDKIIGFRPFYFGVRESV